MRYEILAVCGGNGSWIYPMKDNLIGNIEPRSLFHTQDNVQWKKNFGDIPYWRKADDMMCFPDVIVGAPDCGSSSMMALTRAKEFSNPLENDSFMTFFECIQYMHPSIFFMENLPKAKYSVEEVEWIKKEYHLHYLTGSVLMFGNSQKGRIRLVVMGIRKNFPINHKLIWKHITKFKEHKPKTTGVLLKGLKHNNLSIPWGHITEPINSEVTMYAGFKMTLSEVRRYWLDHPNEKRFIAHKRKYSSAPGVYRNLKYSYPQVARKSNRQFNPDGYQMSPRELARIQGIPDEFIIHAEKENINYWINKGRTTVAKCPPYEIGTWISESLEWVFSHRKLHR